MRSRRTILTAVGAALAVAAIVLLGAVRPILLVAVLAGAALGLAIFAVPRLARARRLRAAETPAGVPGIPDAAAAPLRRQAIGRLVAAGATVALVAVVAVALLAGGGGGGELPQLSIPADVRAIPYAASLQLVRGGHDVIGQEVVRVSRALLRSEMREPHRLNRSELEGVLGTGWRYAGSRGAHHDVYAFVHPYDLPVKTAEGLRILRWNSLPVTVVHSTELRSALVPRDGSTVEVRTPRRAVYETDPDAKRRNEGSTDVLAFELRGLEDDADRRHIDLRIAKGFGRTSVYDGLRQFTLWSFLKWFLPIVAAAVVAFFVNRFLKRRFPEAPAET